MDEDIDYVLEAGLKSFTSKKIRPILEKIMNLLKDVMRLYIMQLDSTGITGSARGKVEALSQHSVHQGCAGMDGSAKLFDKKLQYSGGGNVCPGITSLCMPNRKKLPVFHREASCDVWLFTREMERALATKRVKTLKLI